MVKKEYIVAVASRLKSVSPDLYDGNYGDRYDPPAVKVIICISQWLISYVCMPTSCRIAL